MFRKLNSDEIMQIADIMLKSLKKRMTDLGYDTEFTRAAVEHLAKAGFDDNYGARPLRRVIQSEVEDMLADEMLGGGLPKGKIRIDFDAEANKLVAKAQSGEKIEKTENAENAE